MKVSANEDFDVPKSEARLFKCSVDGEDVSVRCYEADDAEGYAICYALDDDGRKYTVGSGANASIAIVRLEGKVRLVSEKLGYDTDAAPAPEKKPHWRKDGGP